MERKQSSGFRRIFTAFLLFLPTAVGSMPCDNKIKEVIDLQ